MQLKKIAQDFTMCKVKDISMINLEQNDCFIGRTDEECSLVCPTNVVPNSCLEREDGWKAFRIQGPLEFSLIGILARIATLLAEQQIAILAISTYQTDYIWTKAQDFERALEILSNAGFEIV